VRWQMVVHHGFHRLAAVYRVYEHLRRSLLVVRHPYKGDRLGLIRSRLLPHAKTLRCVHGFGVLNVGLGQLLAGFKAFSICLQRQELF